MSSIVLIPPTTSAVSPSTSSSIKIKDVLLNSSIVAVGLASGEQIPVVFTVDDGANWIDLYANGVQAILESTNNAISLGSCLHVSVNKPVTAGPVGVYLSTQGNT